MSSTNCRKIKRVIVFGGTSAAFFFILEAIKSNIEVIVVTTTFRLSGMIDKKRSFRDALSQNKVKVIEAGECPTKEILLPLIDESTIGFSIVTFCLFKEEILDLFQGRFYNYHGALLPEEKGGGTFTHKILSQFYEGGVNIHKIDSGIDTGPIILEKRFDFPDTCIKTIDFENYKKRVEKEILGDFLKILISGIELKERKQQDKESFYFPLVNTVINGVIDWKWSCQDIDIFIKAFDDPYDGASTKYEGKVIHLKNSEVLDVNRKFHPFQSGIVLRKDAEGLYIATVGGVVKVGSILDRGGNDITKEIKLGYRFHSPVSMIERSLEEKARYGSSGLKNKI